MNKNIAVDLKKHNAKKTTIAAISVAAQNVVVPWALALTLAYSSTINHLWYVSFPFFAFYLGTRFRAVNNMSHECVHGTYCSSGRLNEAFGELFAIVEHSRFTHVRKAHFAHHRYLGHPQLDLDLKDIPRHFLYSQLTRRRICKSIAQTLTLKQISHTFTMHFYDSHAPLWAVVIRHVYSVFLIIFLYTYPVQFLSLMVVPYLYFFQIHKNLTDLLDHAGLFSTNGSLNRSRNFIIKNPVLSALLTPRHDGYHLVHHLFPWLAVENHKRAHEILLSDAEYCKKTHYASQHLRRWLYNK